MDFNQTTSQNPLWDTLAARAGLVLSPQQHQGLSQYLDLLLAANRSMNLTRITDPATARVQHVGDALTLLPHLPPGPLLGVDVGAGGGVPGIPLAIARPDVEILLVESTAKKAAFLREAAQRLKLQNVTVEAARAEDLGRGRRRESFDFAVARAVGAMVWLAEWCLPLLRKGGRLLAMKGQRIAEELPEARKAIQMLSGGEPVVHPVILPGAQHHVIVEVPKIGRTPDRFPRPATQSKGRPLG